MNVVGLHWFYLTLIGFDWTQVELMEFSWIQIEFAGIHEIKNEIQVNSNAFNGT